MQILYPKSAKKAQLKVKVSVSLSSLFGKYKIMNRGRKIFKHHVYKTNCLTELYILIKLFFNGC